MKALANLRINADSPELSLLADAIKNDKYRNFVHCPYTVSKFQTDHILLARIQKFLPEGVQLRVFNLMRGGLEGPNYHYKRVIIGPPASRHLNGVSLACR